MGDESTGYRPNPKISVVVLTYNCAAWISRTLVALSALPEQPNIIVVDNGSQDKTIKIIQQSFPLVEIIRLSTNIGAAARNQGVQYAQTPYVAFCDDDTWWAPGSLKKAVELFDRYDKLGLINAKIAVGAERTVDSISEEMAQSPLPPRYGFPGHTLLSFMGGAAAVRREAFLQVGGYDARLFLGGEEELLGCDLMVAGWEMRYIPEAIVHHYPSNQSSTNLRHYGIRNTLWISLAPPALASSVVMDSLYCQNRAQESEHLKRFLFGAVGIALGNAGSPGGAPGGRKAAYDARQAKENFRSAPL